MKLVLTLMLPVPFVTKLMPLLADVEVIVTEGASNPALAIIKSPLTLPVAETNPFTLTLPNVPRPALVMLPVALINPPVKMLPPSTFPVELEMPPVNTLPPVMLPVALIVPPD